MIETLLMMKPAELGRLVHVILCAQAGREADCNLVGVERYIFPLIKSIVIEPTDTSALVICPAEGERHEAI